MAAAMSDADGQIARGRSRRNVPEPSVSPAAACCFGRHDDREVGPDDMTVPDYLVAMARRVPPPGTPVVRGSTPVVSFGNPGRTVVATLGINPSAAEFTQGGLLLADGQRASRR